ncbi:MAG: hypothetical protein QM802_17455 [Agriterribacter sp.]
MIIYKRHIEKRLLALRLSIFILGAICILAFKFQNENLGYFIAVILILFSIIVVKDFEVRPNSLKISKYYFWGLFCRRWEFNKEDNIKVSSLGLDFGQEGDTPDFDDAGAGIGCLFSIFSLFAKPKITMKQFKIDKFDESNIHLKSVRILLNRSEFKYLETFVNQLQSA